MHVFRRRSRDQAVVVGARDVGRGDTDEVDVGRVGAVGAGRAVAGDVGQRRDGTCAACGPRRVQVGRAGAIVVGAHRVRVGDAGDEADGHHGGHAGRDRRDRKRAPGQRGGAGNGYGQRRGTHRPDSSRLNERMFSTRKPRPSAAKTRPRPQSPPSTPTSPKKKPPPAALPAGAGRPSANA